MYISKRGCVTARKRGRLKEEDRKKASQLAVARVCCLTRVFGFLTIENKY